MGSVVLEGTDRIPKCDLGDEGGGKRFIKEELASNWWCSTCLCSRVYEGMPESSI